MKTLARNLVLSAAVAATALAAVPSAQARDINSIRRMDPHTEAIVGIGFLGLAAGVLVGALAAESNSDRPVHRNPRPRPHQDRDYFPEPPQNTGYQGYGNYHSYDDDGPRYRRSRVEYHQGYDRPTRRGQIRPYEAWSPEWARWCQNRYRSFNINTGTFTTYGGEQRFCVVQ